MNTYNANRLHREVQVAEGITAIETGKAGKADIFSAIVKSKSAWGANRSLFVEICEDLPGYYVVRTNGWELPPQLRAKFSSSALCYETIAAHLSEEAIKENGFKFVAPAVPEPDPFAPVTVDPSTVSTWSESYSVGPVHVAEAIMQDGSTKIIFSIEALGLRLEGGKQRTEQFLYLIGEGVPHSLRGSYSSARHAAKAVYEYARAEIVVQDRTRAN